MNGGTGGNANLTAGTVAPVAIPGTQTISAHDISLTNSGVGGVNSTAVILGTHQTITATGNVTLTAQASGTTPGTLAGARIGGNGGATDLNLHADGNLTLNGGSATDNGVGIGSSGAGTPFANTVTITTGGNVVLNSGTAAGTGARIGSGANGTAAGNISVTAGGDIQLNGGGVAAAAIRTTGDVSLVAANMSESGNGSIVANKLTLKAGGNANLGGPNQVSILSAPNVPVPPPAPPGAFVPGVGGSLTFNNTTDLTVADTVSSGGAMNINVAGALNVNGNGVQDALLLSFGGQNITAQSINLTAENNRRSNIENRGVGNQTITATSGGMNLQALGGSGVAQIVNSAPGAGQTLSMTGLLNVLGGTTTVGSRNSGVFQNADGLQSITASGILLQASDNGNVAAPSGALISSAAGLADQTIQITGGSIVLNGASGGSGNGAAIVAGRDQTITGNADIFVNGGAGGNASITAGVPGVQAGVQTISAHDISLTNAAAGGSGSSGTLLAETQIISATGNVTLTSQASGGTLPGTRIGGFSGTGSNVNLTVGGNLTISGGSAPDNGAGIGSSASGAPGANTVAITAGGNVVLNGGGATNAGARIGYSTVNGPAGGNISVTAGGNIELNGNTTAAGIRTTGNVSLTAGGVISENANGLILANALTTASGSDTTLIGPNQVASFSGTSTGGSVTLNNAGPLVIQAINAANAALITASSVHGNGAIATGTGFTVDVSSVSELDGVISGAGGLNKNGVGFLTLGAVNTYAGDTNVNAGTLALGAAGQTTTGNINIAGGATFRGSPGTYTNAGVIAGNGTLDVAATSFTNTGTLRPGGAGAIGTLTVQGDAVINGTLDIEAQGASAGNYDVLAVTGAATLGGALEVTPINGYAPQGGDSIVPLTFASRSGALNVSPADWSSTYNPANLTLVFSPLNSWIAASGNWDLAANWSLGHVPTNFERVLIDVAGNQLVTVSGGSQFADRLTSYESFLISGGSLSLGGSSVFYGGLKLRGGTLQGAGDILVNGGFTWKGGTLAGSGMFTTAGDSLLAPRWSNLHLERNWLNQGTLAWKGKHGRDLVIADGFTLTNAGILRLAAHQGSNIRGDGALQNNGILEKKGGGTTAIKAAFGNGPLGTLNVDDGTLKLTRSTANEGAVNVAQGATLKVKLASQQEYVNAITGRISGQGTLDVGNGQLVNLGVLAPGANSGAGIGTFTVLGNFRQGATGLLEFDLGGKHAGQYDVLNVEGNAQLSGTLFTRAANGYQPHEGDSFKLVKYQSHSGAFTSVVAPAGFDLDADYAAHFARFTLD
jgi:autotransporter-associated beta strand protein